MVEVQVTELDPFVKAMENQGITLSSYDRPDVFACDCGCIFIPSSEGDLGWYPDRYELAGEGGRGCTEDCDCHNTPHMIDRNGNYAKF